MFYDIFCELCREKGVAPTRAALDIGLSKSTPSAWKKRGLTPQGDALNRIANYFDAPLGRLLDIEEQKEKPAAPKGGGPRDVFDKLFAELNAESQMRVVEEMLKLREGQE